MLRHKIISNIILMILLFTGMVFSIYTNTLAAENNKFGIHLAVAAPDQIEKAAELVNANGGDWGYVTVVLQEDDRNKEKWQDIFNKMRELHLVPIVRIATHPEGESWRKPLPEDADKWVEFLDSLNWVVKDRYVILFNETNHGNEWGGSVDAVDYAKVAQTFAEKLKAKNNNYVIMLGGLDASAPAAAPEHADEAQYLTTVIQTITPQKFNDLFSAWSSHSYPNPGFVGSPYASGRGTVRTYEWELQLLKSLGIKNLPVFITETGWEGNSLSRYQIAQDFEIAFTNVWLPDDRVKAVTPFVLDYQGEPFLGFSFRQFRSDSYYPQFDAVQAMAKEKGDPSIIDTGTLKYDFPDQVVINSNYTIDVTIRNTGQAIWNNDDYSLIIDGLDPSSYFVTSFPEVRPFQTTTLEIFLKSGSKPTKKQVKLRFMKRNTTLIEGGSTSFEIVPLPHLNFKVSLYPKLQHKGNDFEVQLFDEHEHLVYKQKNVEVEHTKGGVTDLYNIVPGRKYRVVILKPYYLPRQTFVKFTKGENQIVFKRMIPLDFNKDGTFTFWDIWALLTHPKLFSLLFP